MSSHSILALLVLTTCVTFASSSVGQDVTAESLLEMHRFAAAQYEVRVSADSDETLSLNPRPIFVWSNPRRARGQIGHVFVWMNKKRPGAVGTIFSHPNMDLSQRRVYHEMHSLSETTIVPDRERQPLNWKPRGGIRLLRIEGAPPASLVASRQTLQIRQLARRFEAHTIDRDGQRWPLRMLSSPLLRYGSEQSGEPGGALLAMVGDAGSDPELILMMEARKGADGTDAWYFAPIRMTDHETYLNYAGSPVWKSVRTKTDTHFASSDGTYQRFYDVTVDAPSQDGVTKDTASAPNASAPNASATLQDDKE